MLDGVDCKSICYNRGCGQTFDPKENKDDSCTFHPGAPVFHDAYKGWSCCNKKCTDFTEFLNIKGCTKSFHSNVKPKEPEKPLVDKSKVEMVYEYRPPVQEKMPRPPFESPQVEVPSTITDASLMEFVKKDGCVKKEMSDVPAGIPTVGTICQNNACKVEYANTSESETQCFYHPGSPIFHEGAKFWSCCKKRSFDFEDFLNQKGCTIGQHCWVKPKTVESKLECRYDWHQTGSNVVVAVYAKRYDPNISKVLLNPVRLTIKLFFPESDGSFLLDIELGGVIDPTRSAVTMRGTKVEVTMRKAEPGSWSKLHIPRDVAACVATVDAVAATATSKSDLAAENSDDEPVDLSDLNEYNGTN